MRVAQRPDKWGQVDAGDSVQLDVARAAAYDRLIKTWWQSVVRTSTVGQVSSRSRHVRMSQVPSAQVPYAVSLRS